MNRERSLRGVIVYVSLAVLILVGFFLSVGIGNVHIGFAEVLPWEDTVMAMNELGSLIDDLQKHGDFAIEKWSK